MARTYREYEEMLKERYEKVAPEDQLDTRDITLSALERRKKRKKRRPYSRETLQSRLRK